MARSRFRSENVQNTPWSDHFGQLRCRKSARRCGAKHISKSTCTKHTRSGPLLEVEMSKKCTPLWREAHLQVKKLKHLTFGSLLEVQMSKKCTPLWRESHLQVKKVKTPHIRNTFGSSDVEKVHAVVVRSTCRSQNVLNTPGPDHFWKFRCRFAWQAQGIVDLVNSEQYVRACKFSIFSTTTTTTLQYTTLHYKNCTFSTVHYTTTLLHYYTTTLLHYYTTLHYNPLHYYIQLQSITLNYTTLHCTTLHYTTFHYTTLHCTTLHYTPLHSTTLNYIALHFITGHHTTTTTTLH